ncbi:hypothetical protein NDU88_000841 [Pleurodeles waltl]|uniref:Uncharacterized protein n=1 Tax=Pleurodeles waltl TaxID=8319 RepID=A0AAV7KPZ5_PLEWA|nr:hypothetical protein NDU88_000841 [Pleurodeles waltl]
MEGFGTEAAEARVFGADETAGWLDTEIGRLDARGFCLVFSAQPEGGVSLGSVLCLPWPVGGGGPDAVVSVKTKCV